MDLPLGIFGTLNLNEQINFCPSYPDRRAVRLSDWIRTLPAF